MTATRLDPGDIALVQTSCARMVPIADLAGDLFYHRLFEIAPELRPLFRGDLGKQGRKLVATLSLLVGSLASLDSIVPELKALAVKHVRYGVVPAHYARVGEAVIWTLEKGLGRGFSPEMKRAWLAVYAKLADTMIAEAYGEPAAG
jgi:hemoglobin-like flavoprotein